jgi:NADPH:quinone reductase-like Zn-dependent oxidoreductase
MFAVRIDAHGGPEVLRGVQVAAPDPGPGQVLVRHEVIGVNYVDTQHHAGAPYPVHLPLIPGIEAAGQVVGVGAGVEEFRQGDRVAYAGPMLAGSAEEQLAHPFLPAPPLRVNDQQLGGGEPDRVGLGADQVRGRGELIAGQRGLHPIGERLQVAGALRPG